MAESHHTASIRIDGEAAGAVEQTRRVTEENRKLKEQLDRTNESARRHAQDSRQYVEALREQERQIALLSTRVRELEQANLRLPAGFRDTARASGEMAIALGVARTAITGVVGLLTGGIVGALASAALGWVGFGSAATKAAEDAEEASKRSIRAIQELTAVQRMQAQLEEYYEESRRVRERMTSREMAARAMGRSGVSVPVEVANREDAARLAHLNQQMANLMDTLGKWVAQEWEPKPGKDARGREERELGVQARWVDQDLARATQAAGRELAAIEAQLKRIQDGTQAYIDALGGPLVDAAQAMVDESEKLVYTWDEFGNRVVLTKQEYDRLNNAVRETKPIIDEQAKEAQRAWERTAENIERALVDAIVRGGKSALEYLQAAFRAAILSPIIAPIVRPFAQAASSIGHGIAGALFGGGGGGFMGSFAGGGMGHILNAGGIAGMGSLFGGASMASVNTSAAAIMGGGLEAGAAAAAGLGGGFSLAAAAPWIGAGLLAAHAFGVFDGDGDAQRTAPYRAGFGQGGIYPYQGDRWFSADMAPALTGFAEAQATREQNIIRNLGLNAGQVAAVNAALAGPNSRIYGFGMEHTDVSQSGAFEQIMAARLQAISSALGRSIEDLTRVMSLSAEQWEATIAQMKSTLAEYMRTLQDQLGISGLERFRAGLATSEYQAPLERLAASQGAYDDTLARALAGDLEAVRAFPGTAQQLLGIGRDLYASGPEFQAIYADVMAGLDELDLKQGALYSDLLKDVPAAVMQASVDQVAAIKQQTATLVASLDVLKIELRNLQPSA